MQHLSEFDYFTTTAKSMGLWPLVFSLVATLFGASATFGTIAYIFDHGSSFIWFLWVSSIALLIQGLFFTKNLYLTGSVTLPHLASIILHPVLRRPVAILIVTAWVAIIAAQLTAAATLLRAFFPSISYLSLLTIFTVFITTYTTLGGQYSVFKKDKLHLLVMISGFLLLITIVSQGKLFHSSFSNLLVDGDKSGHFLILSWFFSKGLATIIGPDIYSRLASASSVRVAQKASLIAACLHFMVSLLVLTLAVLLKHHSLDGESFLPVMLRLTPPYLLIPVALGFLAAFASSCDTTMLSAATIIEYDLIQGKNIDRIKFFIMFIALLSLLIANNNRAIIQLMMSAYNIYSPVVVPMLLVALSNINRILRNPLYLLITFFLGTFMAFATALYSFSHSAIIITVLTACLTMLSYRKDYYCKMKS